MKEQIKGKSANRRFSKLTIVITFIVQLLLSFIICVAIVFHTDCFTTIKKTVIASLMQTGAHQYIARMLLSNKEIKELTATSLGSTTHQNLTKVKPANAGDTQINEYTFSDKNYSGAYVLEIKDPTRVKVAMTQYVGTVGEDTSAMAQRVGAVAAINGGGFGLASESAKIPTNFVIENGVVKWKDKNWGYNDPVNVIALDKNGTLIVDDHSINWLLSHNVQSAVTFPNNTTQKGPLIVNGVGRYSEDDGRNPRTAIAQKKDGTILFVAINGRDGIKLGATYYEVQQILLTKFSTPDNPVETATMLDGGGSTTMYYNGKVINNPSAEFGERPVASAFYVEK